MVLLARIELAALPLPRVRSTTELQQRLERMSPTEGPEVTIKNLACHPHFDYKFWQFPKDKQDLRVRRPSRP